MQVQQLKIKGRVKITVKGPDGSLVIEKDNLVVNDGLDGIIALINGTGTGVNEITDIGFGTDDTPTDPTDTGLTAAFIKAIDAASNPTLATSEITATLLTSENNGIDIEEIGLFMAGGGLFSRVVIPTISKTNLITVSVSWIITLSV